MQITILGGAGIIGREIAKDLAANPAVTRLIIADLDEAGAQRVAASLPGGKAEARPVNAKDHASLVGVLRGSAATVNAVQYYFNLPIMRACLDAGVHYVDLGGLFHTTRLQLELHDAFREAGLSAILGMGSCPGVANVQAGYGGAQLDQVESVKIYNGATKDKGDALDWAYSIQTILDEISLPAFHFRDGSFEEVPALSGEEFYLFDEPIGWAKVHHSLHSEVATIPLSLRDKGIQECFFKISFFGYSEAALRKLQFLAELGLARTDEIEVRGVRVRPRDLLLRLLEETPQRAKPEGIEAKGFKQIATVVEGTKDGQPATLTVSTTAWPHEGWGLSGGTLLVASPPAIVAAWLADGTIAQPGVFPPERIVPAEAFFAELATRGPRSTVRWEVPLGNGNL